MAEEQTPIPVDKDYSQKPQKPIKLKPGIAHERPNAVSWAKSPSEILQAPVAEAVATPPASPPPVQQPAPAGDQWTLHGVSQELRQEIVQAAREDGIPLGEWVEEALREVLYGVPVAEQEAIPQEEEPMPVLEAEEAYETLYAMLEDIRDRLQALEQRRSFWDNLKELISGRS